MSWLTGPKTASTDPILLPGMACLSMVKATVTRDGKTTTHRRYYVSSRPLTAEAYLAAAGSH